MSPRSLDQNVRIIQKNCARVSVSERSRCFHRYSKTFRKKIEFLLFTLTKLLVLIAIFHNNASSRVQRRRFTRKNWKLRFLPQARVSVSLGTMSIWMRNSDLTWPPSEHHWKFVQLCISYVTLYFLIGFSFSQLHGSYDVALQTLHLLRRIVSQTRWSTAG